MKCATSGILPFSRREQNEVEDLKKSNSRIKSTNCYSPILHCPAEIHKAFPEIDVVWRGGAYVALKPLRCWLFN